jgi:uncharacterized protein (DUF433 family)
MTTATPIPHIAVDAQGRASIDDTGIKVIEVVLDHLAYGWSAESIHENHPHLSLAQAYAALAWYYDHQSEIDSEIARQSDQAMILREMAAPSALQRRLTARRAVA